MNLVLAHDAGSVTVPTSTLVEIAVSAAQQVEGVRVLRRRSVELDPPRVRLTIAAGGERPLVEVAQEAQEAVVEAIAAMCDLRAQVEITVGELA
jgi:uncharacterized alkaline shock family protein YloU